MVTNFVTKRYAALRNVAAHHRALSSSGDASETLQKGENNMLNKTLLRHFALGLTLTAGITATALAQSTNGSIRGTVLDPSGALIPRAQVTISNTTGFSRTIASSATGTFALAHLPTGSYSVSIDATGFTPTLEGAVQVVSHKVTRESITLGISVNQEIEVSANENGVLSTQEDTSDAPASSR
jgi:hypothetical protein